MTITVSPDASSKGAGSQNENGLDWFMLLQRLGGQGPFGALGGGGYTRTEWKVYESATRTEGEGISYGKAVRIDQNNINQLGLRDGAELTTYRMDQNGTMTQVERDKNDFSGMSSEAFLVHMDGDARSYTQDHRTGEINITSMRNDAPVAMTIQRVEVNGTTQGYFLAGEGNRAGIYLDASALDFSKMSPEIKQQLMQAEPVQGPKLENRQPELTASAGMKP